MTVETPTSPGAPQSAHHFKRAGGTNPDAFMRTMAAASAWIILLMLAALILVVTSAAMPSLRQFGWGFFTNSDWQPNDLKVLKLGPDGQPMRNHGRDRHVNPWLYELDKNGQPLVIPKHFGALAPVVGTTQTTAIGLVVAIPLSLGAAIFLVRLAPRRLIAPVSFLIEFLAAIPSIAYGLWGMFILEPWLGGPSRWEHLLPGLAIPAGIESRLCDLCGNWPMFHWMFYSTSTTGQPVKIPLTGRDIFCGGLVLGIMVVPIITAISRDILRNVPRAQIEGTIALGATWWQSCMEMLKFSRSGLFGAIMLGLARAAGETMAVLMVMGSNISIAKGPFASGTTMSATIASIYSEAATDPIIRGVLMELALILLAMSLVFNIAARYLVVGGAASRTSMAH